MDKDPVFEELARKVEADEELGYMERLTFLDVLDEHRHVLDHPRIPELIARYYTGRR